MPCRAYRLACLVIICLAGALSLPVAAQPADPDDILLASSPALVDEETAVRRIDAHIAAIEARLQPMVDAYDGAPGKTLRAAFVARGVDPLAHDYAGDWSGFDIYKVWIEDVRPFYANHVEALQQSRLNIRAAGFAHAEDLAYIEDGMRSWLAEEPALAALMQAHMERIADYAFHFGNRLRVLADPDYYSSRIDPERKARLQSEAERHNALAEALGRTGLRAELQLVGARRLFMPIDGTGAEVSGGGQPLPEPIPIAERDDALCDTLRDQREVLVRQLDRLLERQLPEEKLRETANLLRQLREVATGTSSDGSSVAEQVRRLAAAAGTTDAGIASAFTRIADGVGSGTAALAEATAFLDGTISEFELWAERLESMETASAQAQVEALASLVNDLRGRVPVDAIPGLGQLIELQSQMISQIAVSVGTIESRAQEFDRVARAVIGKPIYLRSRSPREVLADARQAATEALARLDADMLENDCTQPTPAEQSLCERPFPQVDTLLANALVSQQHLENQYLGQRQYVQAMEARRDRIAGERADVFLQAEDLRHRLLTATSRTDPRDRARWTADQKRVGPRLEALELRVSEAAEAAATQRLLLERLSYRWRFAVEAELSKSGWDAESRLYLRFCTIDGWHVRAPI